MGYRFLVVGLALCSLALRLSLAIWASSSFDTESYEIVVAILRAGGNVYTATARYNYSPLWFWILWTCAHVATHLNTELAIVVRMLLTVVDAGNALLITVIAPHFNTPRWAGLAYWLSPVTIGVSAAQGQFEALALLPLLLSIWLLLRSHRQASFSFWLCTALAVAIKHLVVFQIWLVLVYAVGLRRALLLAAAIGGMVVLLFVPYLGQGGAAGIVDHVLLYRSVTGLYGLGAVLPISVATTIFISVSILSPIILYRRQIPFAEALLYFNVLWVVLMPGLGQQY
ncbi:MAG: hypothetical protein M3R24_41005 [Chloroflexota bacterium]|nr:hypothetical protein [Chloroflexota bacterium]PLS82261.1 MAG: hypothetical protein CYG59_04625 [Chloroflexota bacterium]